MYKTFIFGTWCSWIEHFNRVHKQKNFIQRKNGIFMNNGKMKLIALKKLYRNENWNTSCNLIWQCPCLSWTQLFCTGFKLAKHCSASCAFSPLWCYSDTSRTDTHVVVLAFRRTSAGWMDGPTGFLCKGLEQSQGNGKPCSWGWRNNPVHR